MWCLERVGPVDLLMTWTKDGTCQEMQFPEGTVVEKVLATSGQSVFPAGLAVPCAETLLNLHASPMMVRRTHTVLYLPVHAISHYTSVFVLVVGIAWFVGGGRERESIGETKAAQSRSR